MQKALICGAGGFIGGHSVDRLTEAIMQVLGSEDFRSEALW